MRIITPPSAFPSELQGGPKVFLAGSIEMGKATLWQETVIDLLRDMNGFVFNPRRADWDSSWEQSITNPDFNQQVQWELDGLNRADRVLFYFEPSTMAPISLMELGLHASEPNKCIVCCPEGYWRKGNVDIVCHRFGIRQVATLSDLAGKIKLDFPASRLH